MKVFNVLTLTMILLLALGSIPLFAGGQKAPAASTVNEAAILNPLGHIPIAKEKVNLSIGMMRSPYVADFATNFTTLELEKDSNVHLDFIYYGANDAEMRQKIELLFAAGGDDLPDIINLSFTLAAAQNHGENGMIIPLDNYVKNSLSYSKPSIAEIGYDYWKYLTTPNGHIYTIGTVMQAYESDIYLRLYTNTAWMKTVGKEMPKDVIEFRDLLRAFKNYKFYNDNTKIYPFIADKGTIHTFRFFNIMITPFVYCNDYDNWLYKDDSGTIQAMYASEGYRQALLYIRGLVDEGLIDPLSFTQDQEQLKAIANTSPNHVIGMTTNYPLNYYSANDPRSLDWALVPALGGPDGKRVASFSGIRVTPRMAITKNCKYPETAFRLLDMLISEKYSMLNRYGENGVDIVPPPAGGRSFYPDISPLVGVPILPWNAPGGTKRWEGNNPYILTYRMNASVQAYGLMKGLDDWTNTMASASLPFVQKERVIGPIIYSANESRTVSETIATVNSYWIENFTRFVVRDLSIENDWTKYLGELRAMGLENYLATARTAYARMK